MCLALSATNLFGDIMVECVHAHVMLWHFYGLMCVLIWLVHPLVRFHLYYHEL